MNSIKPLSLFPFIFLNSNINYLAKKTPVLAIREKLHFHYDFPQKDKPTLHTIKQPMQVIEQSVNNAKPPTHKDQLPTHNAKLPTHKDQLTTHNAKLPTNNAQLTTVGWATCVV